LYFLFEHLHITCVRTIYVRTKKSNNSYSMQHVHKSPTHLLKLTEKVAKIHLTAPRTKAASNTAPKRPRHDQAFTIGDVDCQIVYNQTRHSKGFLDSAMAREVLCGMYKRQPIIMLHAPNFHDNVDDYARTLINAKLNKIFVCNLFELEHLDATGFITGIKGKTINYGLSNYDIEQIKERIHEKSYETQPS